MQPDLFGGVEPRDGSHRLLARLANGGSLPAPARQWRINAAQRVRLAAVSALLVAGALSWAWLQRDDARPVPAAAMPAAPRHQPLAASQAPPAPPQAAVIINSIPAAPAAESRQLNVAALEPIPARETRSRSAKPALPARAVQGAKAADNDEDVALLAAMLKHAKPPKPLPSQSKE